MDLVLTDTRTVRARSVSALATVAVHNDRRQQLATTIASDRDGRLGRLASVPV